MSLAAGARELWGPGRRSVLVQPRRPGLAAGAARAGSSGEGAREGFGCLASVNVNSRGMKTGDIGRGPSMAVLAVAFFSGKSWGIPCRAGAWEAWQVRLQGCYWQPLALLAPQCLCFASALLVSGWGKAEAEHVRRTPKPGRAGQSPLSPFPEKGHPFWGERPVQSRAGLGRDDAGTRSWPSSPFAVAALRSFVPLRR